MGLNFNQNRTKVMGVVNVTPDSFSGDGILDTKMAIDHALKLLKDGADILDIGGESSRPGAVKISVEEELERILPIVEFLTKNTGAMISVDTYKPEVAEKVLELGVQIINDITGLRDPKMAIVVAKYDAYVAIMHMQGDPSTMQTNPSYENIVEEICAFFEERIRVAKEAGISDDKIILDPGIGFGKTLEHNLEIIRNLGEFKKRFHYPILLGTSRKSFIGKITGKENPQDRVWGTAATIAIGINNGADIVRVHDVKEMIDVVSVSDVIASDSEAI
jgi:dihydropteroate synthase